MLNALDDVAIYGSVLSPARVLAHYSAARLAGLATTTYAYDNAGRKASMTDPDGHTATYGYDGDGNQTSLTDAMGRMTSQTFDADNRLTAITYSDGTTPNVTYAYDAAGRRTSMVDGTGTTSYTYNTAKQLTGVTDGAGDSVGYGYDSLGRIDAITYPDGHQVTRGYDADSRLASVADANGHTTSFGYDGDGNVVSTTFGNGVVEATTVDDSDQTTGIDITNTAGTGLATFGYTYTPGGQLATATDSLAPTTDTTYSYSSNRQLVGQDGDPTAYGYDGSGNITALDTGNALTYDPAGRLVTDQPAAGATVAAYGYDGDGNRTSQTTGTATTALGYDQANRLSLYTGPGASAGMAVHYDGDGLRTSSGGDFVGSHDYTWDSASSDLPLLLSDGTNDYLYGPADQVVEQINQTDGTTTYLQHDQIGSVRLLTDTTGAIVGTRSYDPYGTLLAHDGDQTTPFGYTGQYTDPSGLIYLRARYYNPGDAQFLTVDPMLDQTRAWYEYAGADPLGQVDETGACAGALPKASAVAGDYWKAYQRKFPKYNGNRWQEAQYLFDNLMVEYFDVSGNDDLAERYFARSEILYSEVLETTYAHVGKAVYSLASNLETALSGGPFRAYRDWTAYLAIRGFIQTQSDMKAVLAGGV